jgi:hypothetical protein
MNRCDAEEVAPPSSSRLPTLRPAPTASGLRVCDAARNTARDLPIHEILLRFELGDFTGALVVAGRLLDDERVPVIALDVSGVAMLAEGPAQRAILELVDGARTVEEIVDASGLSMLDAFRALCQLAERDVLTLR